LVAYLRGIMFLLFINDISKLGKIKTGTKKWHRVVPLVTTSDDFGRNLELITNLLLCSSTNILIKADREYYFLLVFLFSIHKTHRGFFGLEEDKKS
jgi:hypothetical protein